MLTLAAATFLVPDYDEAIGWFCGALGFELIEDRKLSPTKRWVVVAPAGGGAKLILAQADTDPQRARIGDATGGRVAYFLQTDDFTRDHARMQAKGVRFLEAPRSEDYGTVAVFVDPWGGKWDLIEPMTRRG